MVDQQEKVSQKILSESTEDTVFKPHDSYMQRLEVKSSDSKYQKQVKKLLDFMKQDPDLAAKIWALDREDKLTDTLTGLGNRRALVEELSRHIAAIERDIKDGKTERNLSVIYIDADYLKEVNDGKERLSDMGLENSGHDKGDLYLTTVAKVLREITRESDFLSRIGGDEFVVILPEANAIQGIVTTGRIASHFEENKLGIGLPEYTGLSLGVAQWSRGESPSDLIKNADRDLYKSKKRRKG